MIPVVVLSPAGASRGSRMTDQAFDGVRVVELAQWVFVPVAGALLADWGAEVVHIEPTEGDPYRGLATQGIGTERGGVNLSLALANRGKRSIALDIRHESGLAVLHELLESADVFLTNMRPGALRRGWARRRDADRSATRDWCTREATGTAPRDLTPTRPAMTPRPSGPGAEWPTS